MIPLCLVTGFLGSGKTTLLQRTVERYRGRRAVYLVNEFSAVDVDGRRLNLPENELVSIPGGSIFCKCLVGEFIGALEETGRLVADGEAVEGVVVEASGIANPMVIEQMLAETGLAQTYRLQTVVAVIDPGSFYKLYHTLPNIHAQVRAADAVLMNKTDLHDEARLAETERLIREIRPDATILRTVRCEAALDLFGAEAAPARHREGEYALCADPNYATVSVRLDEPVDWPKLRGELDEMGEALYRAKGLVPTPAGRLEVDFSASGWGETPAGAGRRGELVMIAGGPARRAVERLCVRVRSGEYDLSDF